MSRPKMYIDEKEALQYKKSNSLYPKYNINKMIETAKRLENKDVGKDPFRVYDDIQSDIEKSKKHYDAITKQQVEEYLLAYNEMLASRPSPEDSQAIQKTNFIDGYPVVDMDSYEKQIPRENLLRLKILGIKGKVPGYKAINNLAQEYVELNSKPKSGSDAVEFIDIRDSY